MDSWKKIRTDAKMALSRQLNRGWSPPDRVSVNLTLRCNLTCSMCSTCYDSPELTLEEIQSIIDQTADWGVEVFNPLGGEPFMRSDLEEILRYAVRKGFYVTMTTNATLISKGRARMLASIPSDRLHFNISLDGNAQSNDAIRGAGMYQKAIRGFQAIRQADQEAGNSKRKILCNTILHRNNLHHFKEILAEQETLGFDGIQILNLFRTSNDQPSPLWFRDSDFEALEQLCAWLIQQKKQGGVYAIQNSIEELSKIPAYYREALKPLDAPCWAGWKELYINADGQAVMCDGNLDFLNGAFGSIRDNSLQELWDSPKLRQQRQVVKNCTTPCVQTCYLRQSSDSKRHILKRSLQLTHQELQTHYLSRFKRWQLQRKSRLILELSDVSHSDYERRLEPYSRWQELTRNCSTYPNAENWNRYRDQGILDFGRGFMGFDLLRKLLESLLQSKMQMETLVLGWRGEIFLHPEIEPMLDYLHHCYNLGVFQRLEIHTSGEFLTESNSKIAAQPIPQRWIINVDQGCGAGVALLQKQQGQACHIVLTQIAIKGVSPNMFAKNYPYPIWVGERPPFDGNYFWFQREECNNFFQDQQSEQQLLRLARESQVQIQHQKAEFCQAAGHNLVVSWDGKVSLCTRDRLLENRIGDANHDSLSQIWKDSLALQAESASFGRPNKAFCRDCGFWSGPNGP